MRQQAQALVAQTSELQAKHDKAILFLRGRAASATSETARAVFEEEIRSKERKHASDLQQVEAKAAKALAIIEQGDDTTPLHKEPPVAPPARNSPRISGALALAFAADARTQVPQTEARSQAIRWLDGQERSCKKSVMLPDNSQAEPSIAAADPTDGQPRLRSPPRPQQRTISIGRKGRMQAVRRSYEALGVTPKISDSELDRVYTALLKKEDPANNPSELAGYYEKKSSDLKAAYACIMSHRGGSASSPSASGAARPRARRASSDLAI